MQHARKITADVWYVGGNDRRLAKFENCFPIPNGVSYNSFLVLDEKTVLLDTCDKAVGGIFLENIEFLLKGRSLDYIVVNHMEPDHAATLADVLIRHPEATVVGNAKTHAMIRQFFELNLQGRIQTVKEGDTLCTGRHTFRFVMAPMVHWPEVMVTYDEADKILFSADAFGTFGALNGNLYADQTDIEKDWLPEGRRYYANIVGKYGTQVQTLLNKAAGLEISMICPLHGPIWRSAKKIEWLIGTYAKWATYRAEDHEAVIFYASVYGGTENAAEVLADALGERKVRNIRMYDVSVTDVSYLVSEAFRADHLVFLSTTYNNDIFPAMEFLITDLKAHNLQNRKVALIENGSWAPVAGKKITEYFSGMKNLTVMGSTITMKSTVKEPQRVQLEELADIIAASIDEADRM
ncbi:MAG: FprA family A-type flavoprotein [Stomatobaculum sp.]|jgi:flavorubredoxin|nr:FprA family A-type flavoprotein [Stomatobaculum sp.]